MIPADDRMRMGIVGNCLAWQLSNKIAALQLAYSTLQQKSKSKSKGNFLVATIVKVPPGARDSKQLKSSTI